jgi:hypothetical protein
MSVKTKLGLSLEIRRKTWRARRDLNLRPLDSKSTALSNELRAHQKKRPYCTDYIRI